MTVKERLATVEPGTRLFGLLAGVEIPLLVPGKPALKLRQIEIAIFKLGTGAGAGGELLRDPSTQIVA